MNKFQFLLSAVFISLFLSSIAYAGNRPGALTINFGPAYEYFDSGREMQNTGVGFVAVDYDFTSNWGIEGLYGFLHTNFKKSLHDHRNISGNMLLIDGVYHYPINEIFEPYVVAGFGLTNLNPNRNEAVNEGNLNAGLGLQLFADKRLAFKFEGRDIYVINGAKNDVMISAGVGVLFDLC